MPLASEHWLAGEAFLHVFPSGAQNVLLTVYLGASSGGSRSMRCLPLSLLPTFHWSKQFRAKLNINGMGVCTPLIKGEWQGEITCGTNI